MSAAPKSVRAAVYARVSSEEQVEGTSLDTQRARCLAYCEQREWTVVDLYVDGGVSGATSSRPRLDALMAACRAGLVDTIVTTKFDRFSRSTKHMLTAMDELADMGVGFVSLSEDFDTTTPTGRFHRLVLAGVAELERAMIRERTLTGRLAHVREGGWGGGDLAPYGYRVAGEGRDAKLVVDDREAEMIRTAVSLLVDHGMTTGQVASHLNSTGMTPRRALTWSGTNLRNVLTRKRFDGTWTFGKGWKGEQEAITVAVEPILTPERHQALLAYLKATTTQPTKARVHPLSGLLVGTCGHTFHGLGRADRNLRRYRCKWAKERPGTETRCPEPTVLSEPLERAVWQQVLELLGNPEQLMAAAHEHMGLLAGAAKVEADALVHAERRVTACRTALERAAGEGLKMGLDAETVTAMISSLKADLRDAVEHHRMVAQMTAETSYQAYRVSKVQALATMAKERLSTADATLQQQVFRLLNVSVQIVEHGDVVKVRLVGSVAHDLLLASAEADWHPEVLATG